MFVLVTSRVSRPAEVVRRLLERSFVVKTVQPAVFVCEDE